MGSAIGHDSSKEPSLVGCITEHVAPGKHTLRTVYPQLPNKPQTSMPLPTRQSSQQTLGRSMSRKCQPTYTLTTLEGDESPSSPIYLRINASVRVTNSDNLICFDKSPADHANAIAKAVVQAIEEHSSGKCGIPMIDEDGRPRPIHLDVDAGIAVEGKGNVIGNRSIVQNALSRRQSLTKWAMEEQKDKGADLNGYENGEGPENEGHDGTEKVWEYDMQETEPPAKRRKSIAP